MTDRWEWRAKLCMRAGVLLFVSGLVALAGCSQIPALLSVGFGALVAGLVAGVAAVYSLERAEGAGALEARVARLERLDALFWNMAREDEGRRYTIVNDEPLLSLTGAASMLGCTRQTVHHYLNKGLLPAVQTFYGRAVPEAAVLKLLEERANAAGATKVRGAQWKSPPST
jgi:hypothetical protein